MQSHWTFIKLPRKRINAQIFGWILVSAIQYTHTMHWTNYLFWKSIELAICFVCVQDLSPFPAPGIEPGPPGWKPEILTTRPCGRRPQVVLKCYIKFTCNITFFFFLAIFTYLHLFSTNSSHSSSILICPIHSYLSCYYQFFVYVISR